MEFSSPFQSIREIWPEAIRVEGDAIDAAPPSKGAYLLAIRLVEALDVVRKPVPWHLPGGWYIYAGSAKGPGGIRARLRHHFRRDKRVHWHVDHLTLRAGTIQALALEGDTECAIVGRLLNMTGFRPGPAGFGSSDCTLCSAHLLALRCPE